MKRFVTTNLILSIALLGFACSDPTEGKAKASVKEPAADTKTDTPKTPASETKTLVIAPENATVEFVGAKVTGNHDGGFKVVSGSAELVDNDPTKSKVMIDITTDSIYSDDEKLTGHLKSEDFFAVEKFPKASFVSTSIKKGGEKGATHTISGNLELHGVKKEITFPATVEVEGDSLSAKSEFVINRKDFDIVYPGMPDDLIKDDVLIKFQVKGVAKN